MHTLHSVNDDVTSEKTIAPLDVLYDELDEHALMQIVGGRPGTAVPCSSCGNYPCTCRP